MSYGRVKKYRERNREYIRQSKQGKSCCDCGEVYPTYVLQYDHVPERGPKLFQLASGKAGTRSIESIDNEMAKCDIVCANCHAERTYSRAVAETVQALT